MGGAESRQNVCLGVPVSVKMAIGKEEARKHPILPGAGSRRRESVWRDVSGQDVCEMFDRMEKPSVMGCPQAVFP